MPLIEGLTSLGLSTKGTGADNIRNVTGSPTAGIDAQELIDTRPFASGWHHHILNDRSLYGLPRKFNVAFDGGGIIPVLEDTNDIAFTAVTVHEGAGVDAGVWFRLGLGGITGHEDFAKYGEVYVKPDEAIAVADAIVRVFIDHGDRTDRKKARLKYVLDAWGHDKFLAEVEAKLGRQLVRLPARVVSAPNRQDRKAHVGIHAQSQAGKVWAGVVLPVGKMTVEQMRGLAKIARELGDGDIRLTVWQNLLISGIAEENAELAEICLREIGLTSKASSVRAGLIACTGNTGCKFASSNTKDTAMAIADWVEPRVALDTPDQHSSHGLPAFLRPALHRRHRHAGLPRAGRRLRRGHRRGLPHLCRRRLRPRCRYRPRALSRREGRRLPPECRAYPAGLPGRPQRRGDISGFHATP